MALTNQKTVRIEKRRSMKGRHFMMYPLSSDDDSAGTETAVVPAEPLSWLLPASVVLLAAEELEAGNELVDEERAVASLVSKISDEVSDDISEVSE